MKYFNSLSKISLFFLVIMLAMTTFLLGIVVTYNFQLRSQSNQQIKDVVQKSFRISLIDKQLSLERALKILDIEQKFALFDSDCLNLYSTDLLITESACSRRDSLYVWVDIYVSSGTRLNAGYSLKSNILDYYKKNETILASLLLSYLVFVSILTIIFFRFFIETPIRKMDFIVTSLLQKKMIKESDILIDSNQLLSGLYKKIFELLNRTVSLSVEVEKIQFSKQIAHDLRAPLSVLDFNSVSSGSIEHIALRRIKEISDILLSGEDVSMKRSFNLNSFFLDLETLYPSLVFKFNINQCSDYLINLKISETELFRFVSNILKNSVEAKASIVDIDSYLMGRMLVVILKDNGLGVATNDIPKIIEGFSNKVDGNGMGISSIYSKLLSISGKVEITSNLGQGFQISLSIPLEETISYILIDNDKLIRSNWIQAARKNNIHFNSFDSVSSFLDECSKLDKNSFIFIDSDLGSGIRGEIESQMIWNLGFKNIFLATGYAASDFDLNSYPWIKDVVSKKPAF